MFTGIIEAMAIIRHIQQHGTNKDLWLECAFLNELKVDQSIAHNGVCLTVVEILPAENQYRVTAVAETLQKTNLDHWLINERVNMERSLRVGDRLDGHFVQGHVDTTGHCIHKEMLDGSWLYRFQFPEKYASLIIEKGSICINGVSLTVFEVGLNDFTVTIIPYTFEHTNFHNLEAGHVVNLEFDVLGKYLLRQQQLQS